MRRRGSALPVVLLLAGLLLLAGMTLGTLGVFNLHAARGFASGTRARLVAQAAVAQFAADLERIAADGRAAGLNLENLRPTDLKLRDRYRADASMLNPPLPGSSPDDRAVIHFDSDRAWFSVDNSANEFSAAGWLDRGTSGRSVPPFCVDLMVAVTLDGAVRHYEALLSRRWPFAAFTSTGYIALAGTPRATAGVSTVTAPTRVVGDVATLNEFPGFQTMDAEALPEPSDAASKSARLLRRVAAAEAPACRVASRARVDVGPDLYWWPSASTSRPAATVRGLAWYRVPLVDPPGVEEHLEEAGNALEGNAYLRRAAPSLWGKTNDGVAVSSANTFHGEVVQDRFPAGLSAAANPIADVRLPDAASPEYHMVCLAAPPSDVDISLVAGTNFLWRDLTLSPRGIDGGVGHSGSHYRMGGNVANRTALQDHPDSVRMLEGSGRLHLQDCVLYVDGDLDLAAHVATGGPTAVGIEGNNATLVVNGTLVLNRGRLDSRDQGMVIWARNVIMRASGDYKGLIIARNRLTILPAGDGADEVLSVRGALMATGNLILRSVHLTYDPTWLKGVHAYGSPTVTLWRELP